MLALYCALAEEQGVSAKVLQGTTQNDLIKEYLSRGTYIYPPGPSLRLISDMIAWCYKETPKFNPMNVCSYHLREAVATPEQEASLLCWPPPSRVLDAVKEIAVADRCRRNPTSPPSPNVSASSSTCRHPVRHRDVQMPSLFTELWDEILLQRYGVQDPKQRRFRYGVQVFAWA